MIDLNEKASAWGQALWTAFDGVDKHRPRGCSRQPDCHNGPADVNFRYLDWCRTQIENERTRGSGTIAHILPYDVQQKVQVL